MNNLLYRLIALLLGFSLAFGLAEFAVRILRPQEVGPVRFAFDKDFGWIPVPRQQGRRIFPDVFNFTYSNNSQGFRGSREYGPKQPGELRVLLLGDSFTYGLGVNDDQTFAHGLEQHLRQHSLPAEVINAGNPGKGTDYELKLFQIAGVKLHPDLTVLCFFPNDFQDNARAEYYEISPNGELLAKQLAQQQGIKAFLFHFPGYNWLISWSQAANLVKQAAIDYLAARRNDPIPRTKPGDADSKSAGQAAATPPASSLVVSYSYAGQKFSDDLNARLTAIYVAQLLALAKQAGNDLAFCYIPLANEVENYRRTKETSPDEKAIQAIVEARGGPFFSLTAKLAAAPDSIQDLYYAEGHWTRRAHALVGEYLGSYFYNLLQEKHRNRVTPP